MARDREGQLIRCAAAERRFDFSTYDPTSPRSRSALSRALLATERAASLCAWQAVFDYYAVIAQTPADVGGDTRKRALDRCQEAARHIISSRLPWVELEAKATPTNESVYQQMFEQWKSYYGDPDDPVVQERIRRTAEYLQRSAARARR